MTPREDALASLHGRKALSSVFKRARFRQDSEVVIHMDAVVDAKKIRSGFSITCNDAEKMP
jgi:hypothetical protein